MSIVLSNNASSRLASGLPLAGTTINLLPGDGVKFPSPTGGDWFPATIIAPGSSFEIVKVTARSADTLTVERSQEGTVAIEFPAGSRIEHRLTAGSVKSMMDAKMDKAGGTVSGNLSVTGNASVGGTLSVTGNATLPSINSGAPWTSANFNPATKFNVAGGALSVALSSAPLNSVMAQNDASATVTVQNAGGTGDAALAMQAFLAQGAYGIKLGVRADGYFGLGGWSSPAWRWYSDPSGNMVASGNVSAYSDPRLKDSVVRIKDALWIVQQLSGVRFTWNGISRLVGQPGRRDIGVLADEVEAVLPEIVSRSIPDAENDGERWRVVAYDKLAPVLIEAVKELAVRVDALEAANGD